MHPVFQKIIDLLLPPRCLKCGKILGTGGGLCPDCFNEITFIAKQCPLRQSSAGAGPGTGNALRALFGRFPFAVSPEPFGGLL